MLCYQEDGGFTFHETTEQMTAYDLILANKKTVAFYFTGSGAIYMLIIRAFQENYLALIIRWYIELTGNMCDIKYIFLCLKTLNSHALFYCS